MRLILCCLAFGVRALGQDVMVSLFGGGTGPNNHLMVWGDYASGFEFKTFPNQPNPANIGPVRWCAAQSAEINPRICTLGQPPPLRIARRAVRGRRW